MTTTIMISTRVKPLLELTLLFMGYNLSLLL
jgi:hypothetical protein